MFNLDDNKIEIVFENCESIDVNMWVIRKLQLETGGSMMEFDPDHKQMMSQKTVLRLELELDVSDDQITNFSHTAAIKWGKKDFTEDCRLCVDRLIRGKDITHIYINGVCYQVPCNPQFSVENTDNFEVRDYTFKNAWQNTSLTMEPKKDGSQNKVLRISISPENQDRGITEIDGHKCS